MIGGKPPASPVLGWSLLVFTALAWGLNWPVLKLAVTEFHPFGFRAITGLGGVALLLAIALVRGDRLRVPRGQVGWLVLTSILNVTSMMGLATLALLWLRASEAVIVAYTIPVWTTLLAWPVLGERPKRLGVVGLVLGFSGVVSLVAGDVLTLSAADFDTAFPYLRTPTDENYAGVQTVLDGARQGVHTLRLEPGDLQIFKGRYSLHRVTPLAGARARYVAIFSYVEQPGMVGSPERARQLYGRVLPIHIERAGLRNDALVD